ncbi:MAG: hypothetical protein AB7S26_12670 [Sandaracinaceae bacterium]
MSSLALRRLALTAVFLGAAPATAQEDEASLEPTEPPPSEAPDAASPPAPRLLVPPGGVPEVGGPLPGQTAHPGPPPPPSRPPIPVPHYSVELSPRAAFPEESSFDRALGAVRYRSVRVVPTGYVGLQIPVIEWLWLGGRLGVRGMTWSHPEREDASVVGADLLLTAQVRFAPARVFELGLMVVGGAGWMNVVLDGVSSDQVCGRFAIEGIVAFRPDAHFTLGPRFGWEYFQWEHMNAYDHGLDLGGPFFGIALEGRE